VIVIKTFLFLKTEKKKTRSESVDCTPPDYIMPNNKDRPLLPLHPTSKDLKGPLCIKVTIIFFILIIIFILYFEEMFIAYCILSISYFRFGLK
jgi:hypothetical protein